MITEITREELKAKMDRGEDLVVVEALGPRYYEDAHLPGAINIPYTEVEELAPAMLPDRSVEIVSLLLLDEPLSALDANLREGMRELIKEVQREGGHTTVFVTHDQEEAVVLADRIALVTDGRLRMYDRPEAFYDRPLSREIAEFFGAANFLNGRAENGAVQTPLGALKLENLPPPGEVTLTIRPEAVLLEGGENSFSARVLGATYLGTQVLYGLDASGVALKAALPPHTRLTVGDKVMIRLPAESLWALEV